MGKRLVAKGLDGEVVASPPSSAVSSSSAESIERRFGAKRGALEDVIAMKLPTAGSSVA